MAAADEEVFHDALHEAGLHHAAAASELELHHHPSVAGDAVADLVNALEGDINVTNSNGKRPYDETNVVADADYGVIESEAKRQKADDTQGIPKKGSSWDAMFEKLVAYKNQHGDCLVPKRYAPDPKLGTWVETQRVQYKRLQREFDEANGIEAVQPNKRLNQERLEKLTSIGFAWSAKGKKATKATAPSGASKTKRSPNEDGRSNSRSRLNDNFEEMYERLRKYKEEHGDTLVPRKYDKDPRLAAWVETQRVLWNRDYREATSASLVAENGSTPPPFPEHAYMEMVAASLPSAKDEEVWPSTHPDLDDPHKDITHPGGFATTEEDPALLVAAMGDEEIVEIVDAQQAAVVAAAAAAAAEVVDDAPLEEESLKMPAQQPKQLTQERKDRLDALGFVWSLRSKRINDNWDEMYRQLVQYKGKHGDCLVPSRYEENLKLGKWVETQRYEYTKLQRAVTGETEPKGEAESSASAKRPTNPRLTEERLNRLEAIGFEWKVKHKMKRFYDKQWNEMLERLLKFKEANGHCMVPKRYNEDQKLATWVHTQRIQYRKIMGGGKPGAVGSDAGSDDFIMKPEDEASYRLTEDRRKRLEEVGFVWSARENDRGNEQSRMTRNSYDDQWDGMFNQLKAYKEKYGDCLVPKRFSENQKLGTWVDTQRVQYKKLKKKLAAEGIEYRGPQMEGTADAAKPIVGRLTDDRIRRLEQLGFVWSLRDDWQKHYEELKEYKREHGHCNVPARYTKNRRLGIWVSAQRQQFKAVQKQGGPDAKGSARLTQERIDLLNDLGFVWTIRSRDSLGESWHQRYQELKDYRQKHGNCLVPSRYPPNPELGIWTGTQRTQYRLYMKAKQENKRNIGYSAMTEERISLLEEIGFVWALRSGESKKGADDAMNAEEIEREALRVAGALASSALASHVHGSIVGEVSEEAILQTVMGSEGI